MTLSRRSLHIRNGLLALLLVGLLYWAWNRRQRADDVPVYEGKALQQWIEDLEDSEIRTQRRAAAVLLRTGAPAAPELVAELSRGSKNYAALLLVRLGTPAVPALLDGLRQETVCRESARVLGLMGPRAAAAMPTLIEIVQQPSATPGLRAEAAGALGRIGGSDAKIVTVLSAALKDEDPQVRQQAAESLSWLGPSAHAAVPALIAALKDDKEEVAAAACLALAHPEAFEAAADLFQAFISDRDEVARKAGHALWQLGPKAYQFGPQLRTRAKGTSGAAARARSLLRLFGPTALPDLIDGLGENDPEVRRTVAEIMGVIGPPARESPQVAPALLAALKDPSPAVKVAAAVALTQIDASRAADAVPILADSLDVAAAAEALGEIGRPARSAVPALIAALRKRKNDDEDEARRSSASRALARIGSPALPALLDALKDKREGVAPLAAESLGWMVPPPKEAVSALRDAMQRDRAHAGTYALALGKIGPAAREAGGALSALLQDAAARPQAAAALVRIDAALATKVLPLLLDDLKSGEENRRKGAVTALGLFGPAAGPAVPQLLKLLKEDQLSASIEIVLIGIGEAAAEGLAGLLNDSDPVLRQRALNTLRQMGASARPAEEAVVKRLSDPIPELRVRATLVFEEIGATSKNAVPPLTANLSAPQDPVRQGAASALGHIGADAKDAAVPLMECLLDSDPFVRYFAALSLGRIGSTDAAIVPALRGALDDPSPQVRLGAVDALMRLDRRWTAEAEPILLALCRPPHDLDTRIRAIDGLVTIAPEKAKPALPLLHSELNGPSAAIRLRAVSLLERIEPERTPHLVLVLMAALRMADPNVRGPIAQELGKLGGKARAAVSSLQRVYQFDIPSVRKEAAKALRAVDPQTAKRIGIE